MSLESQAAKHGVRKCYFHVKLSCGHWIKTRDEPFSKKTKYGCTSGQGCGYQLNWTETTKIDHTERRANDPH